MQTVIDATQKETIIDQQHSCETLIYRHQTILRLLSSAATASTQWRVRELYCQNHVHIPHLSDEEGQAEANEHEISPDQITDI